MTEDLTQGSIERSLRGGFGSPLRFFDQIGSTNTEALAWAKEGALEGSLVVTNHQTQGRGRWGRSWSSAPGKLLQFSLVLRPRMDPGQLGLVTTALGVACAEAIEGLTGVRPTIKWPNDVRIDGRKVAGILVETELSGSSVEVVVAGMGINVGWSTDEIPDELRETTTSLHIATGGEPVDRVRLLGAVLAAFEARYRQLPGGAEALVRNASDRSDVLGREVTVALATDEKVSGRALRLSALGELELETDDGTRVLSAGEIARLR